jgi:hypothetical protein
MGESCSDRHRRREIGLQRQDLFTDLVLIDAFNSLQHVLNRILRLRIQRGRVGNGRLSIGEIGLDIGDLLRARFAVEIGGNALR